MNDGTFVKSLIITAPVIAAAVISIIFSASLAVNPEPTATFTPITTTTRPPTTTTRPPTTTPPPATTVAPATTAAPTTPPPTTTR
jgi:hypothetical protein